MSEEAENKGCFTEGNTPEYDRECVIEAGLALFTIAETYPRYYKATAMAYAMMLEMANRLGINIDAETALDEILALYEGKIQEKVERIREEDVTTTVQVITVEGEHANNLASIFNKVMTEHMVTDDNPSESETQEESNG